MRRQKKKEKKTFHTKVGKYCLALRQAMKGADVVFMVLRQDFDSKRMEWRTVYRIEKTDRLARLDEGVEIRAKEWTVGEIVVVGDESERYVVRAIG